MHTLEFGRPCAPSQIIPADRRRIPAGGHPIDATLPMGGVLPQGCARQTACPKRKARRGAYPFCWSLPQSDDLGKMSGAVDCWGAWRRRRKRQGWQMLRRLRVVGAAFARRQAEEILLSSLPASRRRKAAEAADCCVRLVRRRRSAGLAIAGPLEKALLGSVSTCGKTQETSSRADVLRMWRGVRWVQERNVL